MVMKRSRATSAGRGEESERASTRGKRRSEERQQQQRRRKRQQEEEEDVVVVEERDQEERERGGNGGGDGEEEEGVAERLGDMYREEVEKCARTKMTGNMSGSERSLAISQSEISGLVADVVRHVLFKSHQTHAAPIKPDDITAILKGKGYSVRGLPALVTALAQERLARTFGLHLKEVKRLAKRKTKATRSAPAGDASQVASVTGTYFVLESLLPEDMRRRHLTNESVRNERAFIMVVLSLLYAANEPVAEDVLFNQLSELGAFPSPSTSTDRVAATPAAGTGGNASDDAVHPTLGFSIRAMLTKMCQLRYISRNKSSTTTGAGDRQQQQQLTMYEIAEGVEHGITEKEIQRFIATCIQAA